MRWPSREVQRHPSSYNHLHEFHHRNPIPIPWWTQAYTWSADEGADWLNAIGEQDCCHVCVCLDGTIGCILKWYKGCLNLHKNWFKCTWYPLYYSGSGNPAALRWIVPACCTIGCTPWSNSWNFLVLGADRYPSALECGDSAVTKGHEIQVLQSWAFDQKFTPKSIRRSSKIVVK